MVAGPRARARLEGPIRASGGPLILAELADPSKQASAQIVLTPARLPAQGGLDRDGAPVPRHARRAGVRRLLHRILVEARDLARLHARGCEPAGQMDVAEPVDV